jgi:hypothetical protein
MHATAVAQALNDVAFPVPHTLAPAGCAGVLRRPATRRRRSYLNDRAPAQPYTLTIVLNPEICRRPRRAAEGTGAAVAVHGPVPQADLLAALGIGVRLESLLQGCRGDGAAAALTSGYNRRAPVLGVNIHGVMAGGNVSWPKGQLCALVEETVMETLVYVQADGD